MTTNLEELGFKRITPKEIEGNTFKLFGDWALVTAGKENAFNTMTIEWGDFGVVWGREIITVYIAQTRYTKEFVDNNDYFTVEFFPQEYKKDLGYLGSHSGRDEDKLAKTKLTPVFTPLGNATFKESKIIIEAKKIYSHKFDHDAMHDEVKNWYGSRSVAVHSMYIGEIVNVWVKD